MNQPAAQPPPNSSATVLVIEHDEATLVTYQRILELGGFSVRTAISAPDALRDVVAHPPDAIVVDFRMPVMDGLAFLRALRARLSHAATPVAIVTGDYQLDERLITQLQDLGAVIRFKPLWVDELTALANQLLGRPTR